LTNWTFVCFWGVVDNVDFLFFGTDFTDDAVFLLDVTVRI